jgi:hypothetical protein
VTAQQFAIVAAFYHLIPQYSSTMVLPHDFFCANVNMFVLDDVVDVQNLAFQGLCQLVTREEHLGTEHRLYQSNDECID